VEFHTGVFGWGQSHYVQGTLVGDLGGTPPLPSPPTSKIIPVSLMKAAEQIISVMPPVTSRDLHMSTAGTADME